MNKFMLLLAAGLMVSSTVSAAEERKGSDSPGRFGGAGRADGSGEAYTDLELAMADSLGISPAEYVRRQFEALAYVRAGGGGFGGGGGAGHGDDDDGIARDWTRVVTPPGHRVPVREHNRMRAERIGGGSHVDPAVQAEADALGMSVDEYLAAKAAAYDVEIQATGCMIGARFAPIASASSLAPVDPIHGLTYNQIYGILEDNIGDPETALVGLLKLEHELGRDKLCQALSVFNEHRQWLHDIAADWYPPESTLITFLRDGCKQAVREWFGI